MYGKLFAQMFEGTLATKGPWEALITFQQLIVLADRNGVVDMTPEAISRRTTIPLPIIQKGIRALERPDPQSRTPDEGGRRIVRLSKERPWGWRIVNYAKYRNLRSQEERREYHRRYWHEKRSKKASSTPLNNPSLSSPQQDSTDSTKATSSKHKEETTTTTTGGGGDLVFPKGLTARQIHGIEPLLNGMGDKAQMVLDELSGAMKKTTVSNPVGYIRTLVAAAKAGTFSPERAHAIADVRELTRECAEARQRSDMGEVIRLSDCISRLEASRQRVAL